MPSTAASHMIFFIAAIVVSMTIAGTLIATSNRFSEDIEGFGSDLGDSIRTSIKICNDPAAMPYNASNNTLTVYVMNTGSTGINADNTTIIVMINGTYYENLTFVLKGGGSNWRQKTMLTIVVGDVTLPADDHRLRVLTLGGGEDTLEFRID